MSRLLAELDYDTLQQRWVEIVSGHDDPQHRIWFAVCAALSGVVWALSGPAHALAVLSSASVAISPLKSGIWVLRNDPCRRRGRVCCLFHVSAAVWLGAPAALATVVAAIVICRQLNLPLPNEHIRATFLSLFVAVGISAILGALASFLAWKFGYRVWVHRNFVRVLREELRGSCDNRHANYGMFVLATSTTLLGLPFLAVALINEMAPWKAVLCVLSTIALMLLPCHLLPSRIFAAGPLDYLESPPAQ